MKDRRSGKFLTLSEFGDLDESEATECQTFSMQPNEYLEYMRISFGQRVSMINITTSTKREFVIGSESEKLFLWKFSKVKQIIGLYGNLSPAG